MIYLNSLPNLLAVLLLLIFLNSCAIQPTSWSPPLKPEFKDKLALNEKLSGAEKIPLRGYYGAEEFAIDKNGNIFCGVHIGENDFSSGAILKINPDDSVEEWLLTNKWITGMQFDKNGNFFAMMSGVGLVQIKPDKTIDTLTNKSAEGLPFLMGTGMKVASDGKIYFVNMSSTNEITSKYINKIILEMKPTGGVYCYDPILKTTTTISTGNYFGNGLEISEDGSYLLVSETSKYQVLKYWLKGKKAGQSEVLMDNLAGFPNNISRRDNSNYWIGFTTKRNDKLDEIHPKKGLKKFIYGLPSFVQPKAEKFGMVLEVSPSGEIIQALFDSKGETVTEAGAVKEWKGYLYLGGDVVSYVSKVKLF